MTLQRFEPFGLINLLNRDLDRVAGRRIAPAVAAEWIPAVDVTEQNDRFVLHADLPGVNADDIDIRMEEGFLTLSGARQRENEQEVDGLRRFERSTGKFIRRFALPDSADADRITARSANGILEVVIPKQSVAEPRRIAVEAA